MACLAIALGGCSLVTDSFATNDFSGDPFPIEVDTASGAIIAGLRTSGGDHVAVLDLLSPVSVVDPGPDAQPSVITEDLLLLGKRAGTGTLDVPRAEFVESDVLALHPCHDDACAVGPVAAPQSFDAIIGANSLAGDAIRIRAGDDRIFVLPDIGGQDRDRTYTCDAVFPSPYRGGGTLVIAGTELAFEGRRVTLQACLGFDAGPSVVQGRRGADMLLVASTSIGRTLLGASAYERYRNAVPTALPFEMLPEETVFLPSGTVSGRLAHIPRLALVATSGTTPHAPCRQVFAHHLLSHRDCCPGDDCPCENGATFCAVPGILELQPPAEVQVLVIDDANPTLQALRTELRPDQPEVDGVLGLDVLRDAEVDIDYPHDRVLGRCAQPPTGTGMDPCTARPALADRGDRTQILGCVDEEPGDVTCPK